MSIKNNITTALKGMIVGATMLVPGVSGGSMAMILGIYDRLISSVSSFFKDKKVNAIFLALFAIGGVLGMVLFAKPILGLIERFNMPMMYFFMGAVAGSVPFILGKAKQEKISAKSAGCFAVGFGIVMLFALVPEGGMQLQLENGIYSYILLALAGFVAAVALVLPGISVSYLLLLMGLYHETMDAISTFYLPFLVPLGLGVILGILLTTRILEQAMEKKPQVTYLIILGFIIGSVIEIFPGIPSIRQIPICVITLFAGFGIIRHLAGLENN